MEWKCLVRWADNPCGHLLRGHYSQLKKYISMDKVILKEILFYIYNVLDVIIVYIALVGTWEIAQATIARGLLPKVWQNRESDKNYKPLDALHPLNIPLNIKRIVTWWFRWKSEESGISDMQILKKRFSWGLRYLILSIVFKFLLGKARFLFF